MTTIPTPAQLLAHQLEHYAHRLAEEKIFEARVWLRDQLYHLKKKPE